MNKYLKYIKDFSKLREDLDELRALSENKYYRIPKEMVRFKGAAETVYGKYGFHIERWCPICQTREIFSFARQCKKYYPDQHNYYFGSTVEHQNIYLLLYLPNLLAALDPKCKLFQILSVMLASSL